MNASVKNPQLTVLRKMSVHEASFPVYAELSPGGGNVVSCLELEGILTAEAAIAALQQLQKRHAMLRAGYLNLASLNGTTKGNTPDYNFVEVPDAGIPFAQEDHDNPDAFEKQAEEVCHALLNHHYRHGELLSRVVLLSCTASHPHRHRLYFCVSHSICDGAAIVQLLDEWQRLVDGVVLETVADIPRSLLDRMPPAIERFTGAFKSLGTLLSFVTLQKQADKGLSFAFDVHAPASEHRCIAVSRTLDQEDFSALQSQVKAQNNSLHGAFAAALVAAFTDYLKTNRDVNSLQNGSHILSIPVVTTVNMRDKTSPPLASDTVACLSSGITSVTQVPMSALQNSSAFPYADMSRQVSTGVKQALDADQHWKVLRIYKIAGLKGLRKMFADASQKSLSTPLSLANLGRVKFANSTQRDVKKIEVYAAFHAMGPSMNIVINSLNDQLTLCFTCPFPVCSRATLNTFADASIRHLHTIARG